ncbi:MAG: methyl-accepting chemotaxis protein, partial [Sulfuricellaceae bacterium]|nr:methyl-accepting chemotaxis protein [Sulfuricellaceae bacterium]
MKWFLNLSTRGKLFLGFGLMIVFLATVIAAAYTGIASVQASQKHLYQQEFANVIDLLNLRSDENGTRAAMLSLMSASTSAARDAWRHDIKSRAKDINDGIGRLLERNRDDPGLVERVKGLATIKDAFDQTRDNELMPLVDSGKIEQARALLLGIQQDRYLRMRKLATELGDGSVAKARTAVEESAHSAEQSVRLFVVVGGIAILLGLAMVLLLTHVIAVPLRAVSSLAGQVATGDLTVSVPNDSRADEVGDLLRAFREMVAKLRQTTRELHDGVGVLASSSSEILATTTQVASGAAETATAVSETTATVEEVKQTAQVASQKARYVSDS